MTSNLYQRIQRVKNELKLKIAILDYEIKEIIFDKNKQEEFNTKCEDYFRLKIDQKNINLGNYDKVKYI